MRTLKTKEPKGRPVLLEQFPQHGQLLPAALTGSVLIGSLVLAGCSAAEEKRQTPTTGTPTSEASEETQDPENVTPQNNGSSSDGLIDVDGGYTQEEQLAELEIVVEIMQEHFGDDVATINGEPWTAERHDAEVAARPRGDNLYRQEVRFDIPPQDLEELYATAEQIAEELGLTENINNSNGIGPHGRIFYGAGREEGRVFLVQGRSSERASNATYLTRHSDHETVIAAYERVVDKNRQEREAEFGPDNPRQMEDLELDDGEGSD
ncbi:hypothetical protein FEF26_10640 [Nesterenkonia salmonea]|uniref:Uncharacterized protein n=1 Tax=Nesterenkonia salmonea TaxID=1804987 RepID=A0A5R9BB18_9MICC|nr:hypothetical protein [Nesterenkonia salmonea]TLP95062.1 hypothetical protein FEF26_10640 [Nesterenkonia salmonea]